MQGLFKMERLWDDRLKRYCYSLIKRRVRFLPAVCTMIKYRPFASRKSRGNEMLFQPFSRSMAFFINLLAVLSCSVIIAFSLICDIAAISIEDVTGEVRINISSSALLTLIILLYVTAPSCSTTCKR